MSMNDGGGMMELALLFGLAFFVFVGFVVLYVVFYQPLTEVKWEDFLEKLRDIYRKHKAKKQKQDP